MSEIKIAIESSNADIAAEELFKIPGLEGSWAPVSENSPNKEGTLAVVATVIGIVGGAIAIAEQIRKWYQECRKKSGKFDVVIVSSKGRVAVEDASIDEICEILKALED